MIRNMQAKKLLCNVRQQKKGWLLLVPPPVVSSLFPAITCDGSSLSSKSSLTVTGAQWGNNTQVFLRYQKNNGSVWVSPSVLIPSGQGAENLALSNCQPFQIEDFFAVELCSTLVFDIWADSLPVQNYIKIANPLGGSACDQELALGFLSLPPATINSAEPNVLCWESGTQEITFLGLFYRQGSLLPNLTIEGATVVVISASGCTTQLAAGISAGLPPNDGNSSAVQKCTTLLVSVTMNVTSVLNKPAAYFKPKVSLVGGLGSCGAIFEPMVILSSVSRGFIQSGTLESVWSSYGVQPALFCPKQSGAVAFTQVVGGSMAVVGTAKPNITIGTQSFASVQAVECLNANIPGTSVSICSGLSVNMVSISALVSTATPTAAVTVRQPGLGCPSLSSFSLFLSPYDLSNSIASLSPSAQTLDCLLSSTQSGQNISIQAGSGQGFTFNPQAGPYTPAVYLTASLSGVSTHFGPFPTYAPASGCTATGVRLDCPSLIFSARSLTTSAAWPSSVLVYVSLGVSSSTSIFQCATSTPISLPTQNCAAAG
eukprot:gb/GEZN01003076.1/.p1 GENE.gb/GEZN01003076.1/~~gb/GEZN01003076.1/.p1  ORF type:complete len:542 (-),score=40.90 gb/GEZN01003076.1/:88-1713(-)